MSLLFRISTAVILLMILAIAMAQEKFPADSELLKRYQQADRFFNDAEKTDDEGKQDLLNEKALHEFKAILPRVSRLGNDSLAFQCFLKVGILEHTIGNFSEANKNYNEAISIGRSTRLDDSILFAPLLYSGIIYYQQSQLDSSLGRFSEAEAIADAHEGRLKETERLFNNLGVLYYETGNYKQAKNYFEKAIEVLQPSNVYYRSLLVNYNINLAQVLAKQEDYDAAHAIYQRLIEYNINNNEIYHNLGTINLNLGAAKEALGFFRKVKYSGASIAKLYNDMGYAFFNLKEFDSARYYLEKAAKEITSRSGNKKNVVRGLNFKYTGDIFTAEGNFEKAANAYQQAIIQFDDDFFDSTLSGNPGEFSGILSYINLFDAMVAKAFALEQLYKAEKNKQWLLLALGTYRSAFKLVDHVQKTYESDEARLFLNQIKYKVHARPIDAAIELYELTKDRQYLEEAYRYDQINKASVLSMSLKETALQQQAGISDEFLEKVAKTRLEVTQLSLRAARTPDSVQQKKIRDQIRDEEIQLSKLQEKINANPKYARLQPADIIPTVSQLQKDFLESNSLLLSYHFSEDELLCIYVTTHEFGYVNQKIDQGFFRKIDSFINALHTVGGGEKYNGDRIGTELFDFVLQPVLRQVSGVKRIIIIPDDELNYLPFEALQDPNRKYLVESFAVQYQYSTALMNAEPMKKNPPAKVLAFAPFTDKAFESFQRLGHSKDEVASLNGNILLNHQATKKNFLRLANHFPIIHLATHASVNDQEPLESFIAFYPTTDDSIDFKLYAQEIYGLRLDSTKLVILSACETGTGQLVRGEGLMSLSRAFAYAGCPNIITSLWKAEDETTAYLTQRLHFYLDKDLTIDEALRQAKLDLLRSGEVDPVLKSPNYWAHLVFIGNYQKANTSNKWWWIAGLIILFTLTAVMARNKSRK